MTKSAMGWVKGRGDEFAYNYVARHITIKAELNASVPWLSNES